MRKKPVWKFNKWKIQARFPQPWHAIASCNRPVTVQYRHHYSQFSHFGVLTPRGEHIPQSGCISRKNLPRCMHTPAKNYYTSAKLCGCLEVSRISESWFSCGLQISSARSDGTDVPRTYLVEIHLCVSSKSMGWFVGVSLVSELNLFYVSFQCKMLIWNLVLKNIK